MKLITNGSETLNGEVIVSGSKNSATKILSAALLTNHQTILRSFPTKLNDAIHKMEFLVGMGAHIDINHNTETIKIEPSKLDYHLIKNFNLPIRTTYLLAAATLVRQKKARIPYPGGCKIGNRGYDVHIMVWQNLGCKVLEKTEYIEIEGTLRGGKIDLPISTVGGTENAILCASVADGITTINNAYITPEVEDLISFMKEMGARIEVEGSSYIKIYGANGLLNATTYSIMPDRIEALTWIIWAVITKSTLFIKNIHFNDLEIPLIHLKHAGVNIFTNNKNTALVTPDCISQHGIQPFELACGAHPGIISDMQPFYVLLALFAKGRSTIYDYRYPERIKYALELEKFAPGKIIAEKGKITVLGDGNAQLRPSDVISPDLRGSMALVMAALCAPGISTVSGVEMALRGYNKLEQKLKGLGLKLDWFGS